ncbi:MAG TPA: helix-turn-helix domain-containing protein [Candidatus Sulfomarinibacteraceae bacterium]|nr:helix-turn-helix domain-containing protein [Candidatus Sulfomarinibacteraceae bacterium]
MHESLVTVNDSTVAGLGRLARFFGFSEVMGRLYGTLLLSPTPLSLDELAERLQISKGSVSMNMRSLERWGMAQEVWMRGERKKYYEAEPDLWQVMRNVLNGRERREVGLALEVLDESVEKLKSAEDELTPEEKELSEFYLERMDDLQAFFHVAQIALETVLNSQDSLDFEEITKIDIG